MHDQIIWTRPAEENPVLNAEIIFHNTHKKITHPLNEARYYWQSV